jgi:DNA mismatch repair protein MutS
VREHRDQVLFLRKLKEGPADKSYGIAVAKLAGLPREVIERARQVLAGFERGEQVSIARLRPTDLPLAADASPTDPVIERLRTVDVNRLSPLEAFNLLLELKRLLTDQPHD